MKYSKVMYIIKVIRSCKTYHQWWSADNWVENLRWNKRLTHTQYEEISNVLIEQSGLIE